MTQGQYIILRKFNILELGKTLGNISDACRKMLVWENRRAPATTATRKEANMCGSMAFGEAVLMDMKRFTAYAKFIL